VFVLQDEADVLTLNVYGHEGEIRYERGARGRLSNEAEAIDRIMAPRLFHYDSLKHASSCAISCATAPQPGQKTLPDVSFPSPDF
jgi:hypothetical protein